MQPLDLGGIVSAAIESSRPFVESGRHELIFNMPEDSPIVDGDAVRLTQVFANLINNAAKYTDVGGHIWVDVSSEDADARRHRSRRRNRHGA